MLGTLTTIAAFLFSLGVIVFVHELGHHLVAKAFGVKVLTFSIGFGRRLWGFRHRGTDYRISLVPLGGYVRMGGELPEDQTGDPSEFLAKPRWQRVLVYLAGPAMNVVLAVTLIAGAFMAGVPMQALQDIPAVVGTVEPGSPAEAAGLLPDDRVVAVDGKPVALWADVAFAFATSAERPVVLDLDRGEERLSVTVTPTKVARDGSGEAGVYPKILVRIQEVVAGGPAEAAGFRRGDELLEIDGRKVQDVADFVPYVESHAGQPVQIAVRREEGIVTLEVVPALEDGVGRIGVSLGIFRRLQLGEALVESVRFNADVVVKTVHILGKLFTREIAARSALSGPIEIADWAGQAAGRGLADLIYMMGFLSISIGLMNLLPIPVLDGGHITILLVESVIRRDLSLAVKEKVTQLGFFALLTLMAVVLYFDLAKRFVPPPP